MTRTDPLMATLTGPGQPFAIVEREGLRLFENAPANLGVMMERARAFDATTFLVWGGERISYAQAFARSDALSGVLDITPGDRVAIAMANEPAWMVAFIATIRAGGIAVLANSRSAGRDMRAQIEECDASVVIADERRADLLKSAGFGGRILTSAELPAYGASAPLSRATATDPAAILFTSGTTGRTKGAVLTHRNLITGLMYAQLSGLVVLHQLAAKMGVTPDVLRANSPQSSTLLVFPLFHISGLGSGFLSQLLAGGKVAIMPRWDVDEALAIIERERLGQLAGVPTMLWDVMHRAKAKNVNLSSLRNVASGGQALPINLLDAVAKAFPSAFVGTGFGLTETAGPIAMSIGEEFLSRPTSAGRVLALADVRTLDHNGAVLPAGEIGEIAVRGPMVMQGYWNRPEDTKAALDAEGWFRTGDIGRVDDEGFIYIVDRKKDMVISGGENIYCAEVERVMSQLPRIRECATFGVPDARMGEKLVAVVVADGLCERAIQDHVAEKLARYKAPARVAFSAEPLPRNATGKVDKKALRAAWSALAKET